MPLTAAPPPVATAPEPRIDTPTCAPALVTRVELADGVPALEALAPDGRRFREALTLVRLHGEPLGLVRVPLPGDGLPAQAHADALWAALAAHVRHHLRRDGLAEVDGLGPEGLPAGWSGPCGVDREELLRTAPPITVVIPTRDRPDRLARCLRSLRALDFPRERLEVVLVDNAPSTEASAELVATEFPEVRYVREPRPGLSFARNRGLAEVRTELVAFTDDDVVADPAWLQGVVRGFRAAPDVACVTGLVVPLALDTPAQVWFEQFRGPGTGMRRRIYDLGPHRPADPLFPYTAGRFGAGNNFAFRTRVLRELGGSDGALGVGTPAQAGEDIDVLFRIVRAGHRLVFEPTALLLHENRRDEDALRRQLRTYGVGLAAFLTKALVSDPRGVPAFLRAVPRGVALLLRPGSEKNARLGADYPRDLRRTELRGMVAGPLAYARGRRGLGRTAGR